MTEKRYTPQEIETAVLDSLRESFDSEQVPKVDTLVAIIRQQRAEIHVLKATLMEAYSIIEQTRRDLNLTPHDPTP